MSVCYLWRFKWRCVLTYAHDNEVINGAQCGWNSRPVIGRHSSLDLENDIEAQDNAHQHYSGQDSCDSNNMISCSRWVDQVRSPVVWRDACRNQSELLRRHLREQLIELIGRERSGIDATGHNEVVGNEIGVKS